MVAQALFGLTSISVHDVKRYGAKGDGTTNDTVAIQAAIDAASTAGGGIVLFPAGTFKVTSLNLKIKVYLVGAGMRATILSGTAGSDIIVLPTAGSNSVIQIRQLGTTGGRRGISYSAGATANYLTYVTVADVEISNPSAECVYTEGQIEEWYFNNVRLSGGTYGFRHANVDQSDGANLVDKSTFKDVLTAGQSEQGWRFEVKSSAGDVTFINPIINTAAKDGFYADGSLNSWIFINANTEGNGQSGKNNRTTGTISAASTSLVVASATGYAVADPITVAGAGLAGADLTTTVTDIAGLTFTLAATATTAVTAADVTNASYDDFRFNSTISAPTRIQFYGGILGGEGSGGKLRYSINLTGTYSATLIGVHASGNIPVYDPTQSAAVFGGSLDYRAPATVTSDVLQATLLANNTAKFTRSQLISPNGKDFYIVLRDSAGNGTGTFGGFEIRRYDTNRARLLLLSGKGQLIVRNGMTLFQKAGAPADADFDETPSQSTIAHDITNDRIYLRGSGGTWKFVPVVAAQPAANPDTSGATLAALETEVNELKAALRSLGLIAT